MKFHGLLKTQLCNLVSIRTTSNTIANIEDVYNLREERGLIVCVFYHHSGAFSPLKYWSWPYSNGDSTIE